MDWLSIVGLILLVLVSYMVGKGSANGNVLTLKRENEQLNKELTRLTDRDERGRFKGDKK